MKNISTVALIWHREIRSHDSCVYIDIFTYLISITNLGLNLNIAAIDLILNQGVCFSELGKFYDCSMEIVGTETVLRLFQTHFFVSSRPRFFQTGNFQI